MGKISFPEPINQIHKCNTFSSGEKVLDDWLKERAIKNDLNDASRTFIVHINLEVKGYYCLSMGSVNKEVAPGKIRRNMPDHIPVMVLGRLAVDNSCHKMGIGKGLLKDAVLRTIKVSVDVAVKALLVHSISESATHFYKRFGFIESPLSNKTLLLPLKALAGYDLEISKSG
ncbi:MAG: GNAT family N-acetyltransferase [Tatlockia sp.]|nr:GNAT family N-acetyltransferase [Tatlockia sp.]